MTDVSRSCGSAPSHTWVQLVSKTFCCWLRSSLTAFNQGTWHASCSIRTRCGDFSATAPGASRSRRLSTRWRTGEIAGRFAGQTHSAWCILQYLPTVGFRCSMSGRDRKLSIRKLGTSAAHPSLSIPKPSAGRRGSRLVQWVPVADLHPRWPASPGSSDLLRDAAQQSNSAARW
jgi:hypothetical protein